MGGLFGSLAGAIGWKDSGNIRAPGSMEQVFRELFGGSQSRTGVAVTIDNALRVTTVLACAARIAEGVATVPLKLYRKDPKTGRRIEARDHPLYEVLASRPNPIQNSLEFRETLTYHARLTQGGFALINRVGGRIDELIPLEPGRVTVVHHPVDGSVTYRYRPDGGGQEEFTSNEVWHLRGPSWNGWAAMEAIRLCREAIGLAIAAEETQATLHANGMRAGGILTFQGTASPEVVEKARAGLMALKRGSTAVFDNGADWKALSLTGVDAQHIETRRFQIEEICRGLGVMPIMVGQSDKAATYASAEQMFLAHLVHCIRPWHRRWEASMDRQLLSEAERIAGYYTGFVDTEFLRGASADRAAYYGAALGSGGSRGWMTQNEVRGLEELDQLPGGDDLPQPIVGAQPPPKPKTPPPTPKPDPEQP